MIASALIVPVEAPPSVDDVKRALLSYDSVHLISPDDRDVVQPHFLPQIAGPVPIPFLLNSGPVRPLGKTSDYDERFDNLIDTFRDAVAGGILRVDEVPSEFRSQPMGALGIGFMSPPPGEAPPRAVYHLYRALVVSAPLLNLVNQDVAEQWEALRQSPDLSLLAPAGQDEVRTEHYINGQQVPTLPPLARFDAAAVDDDERLALSRIAWARVGSLVRCLGICHVREMQPLACSRGIGAAYAFLTQTADLTIPDGDLEVEAVLRLRRLARLHELIMAEYIDATALRQMTVQEVLTLRSTAWGHAAEARVRLMATLREIAVEHPEPRAFDRAVREALDRSQRSRAEWLHEARKFGVKAAFDMLEVGHAALIGGIGASVAGGAGLLHGLAASPTFGALLGLAAIGIQKGRATVPELMDLIKANADSQTTPGYALSRPYGTLLS